MVKDLIKLFASTGRTEEVVLDNYKLKDGIYFKINKDRNLSTSSHKKQFI